MLARRLHGSNGVPTFDRKSSLEPLVMVKFLKQ